MASPVAIIRKQQREWAAARGVEIDAAGYTTNLAANLLVPLSRESTGEFAAGDGDELGVTGRRGKMQALHSSSALGCNVFEYWRHRDAGALARALGLDDGISSIAFERKCPTGLSGHSPNLDVLITEPGGGVTAIECKFLEPYGSRHSTGFRSAYFEDPALWFGRGFEACQGLAERLQSGAKTYRWLNGEQLLKHILGVSRTYPTRWRLAYLWYEVPGSATEEHRNEADDFADTVLSDGLDFRTMSYQQLFTILRQSAGEQDAEYVEYLGGRYFVGSD